MSDPDATTAGPEADELIEGGPGDDAASGGFTGATELTTAETVDEDSAGPGDDLAAGDSTTATGH